jgi:hypothetical protein
MRPISIWPMADSVGYTTLRNKVNADLLSLIRGYGTFLDRIFCCGKSRGN